MSRGNQPGPLYGHLDRHDFSKTLAVGSKPQDPSVYKVGSRGVRSSPANRWLRVRRDRTFDPRLALFPPPPTVFYGYGDTCRTDW
jgi:hypothetical protein